MKSIIIFLITICGFSQSNSIANKNVNSLLNNWHKAAADANFDTYFNLMTSDAVFIGTDATENWTKQAFMTYAKPHFDKGKAWRFTAIDRHIYFSQNNKMAWFDELLNTQMKICRGSGVAELTKYGWKIKHYVLSMTVPNQVSNEVVGIKTIIEDKLIKDFKK
ncbi:MAG: nuclear transport factor 2 family protein [Flavobacterium sp.]|nr:nuclear transport factor 2 family protein [Flavobacterium sp.]